MKKLVIVISGPPGAGSSTIAKVVAKKLKLKWFSPGETHKKMLKGWKSNETKAAMEVWKTRKGASKKTHKDRDKLQVELAKKGDVVISGKLSIHFLKKLTPYKIWLDVPLEVRAKRTAQRDGISYKEAERQITQRTAIERKSWKKIYGFDYLKQRKEADFVINTSKMTIDGVVNKILEFVKAQKFKS